MRQRTRSLLAWRLVVAKPLPMLVYHKLDPLEQTSAEFEWKCTYILSKESISYCRL